MYYAGIDAHLKYLSIAVVDHTGKVVSETRVSTTQTAALIAALEPYRPLEAVVETCPFWPWIYDVLVPTGIGFHLAHAKELEAIAHSNRKTDERDALLLARMLSAGLIPEVYARAGPQRDVVRVLRHRQHLVRWRTSCVNRIHAQLHAAQLSLPREQLLRRATRGWLDLHAWPKWAPEQQRCVSMHLHLIDTLTPLIRTTDRHIAELAGMNAAARCLQTIPGIGPYRGLLLATELGPIERFPSARQVAAYAGLAPTVHNSGGKVRHGGIPRGANRYVRSALVSAVPSHVRAAPESALSEYYQRQKERLGWQVARVATARKLGHIVFRMLKTGEAWRAPHTSEYAAQAAACITEQTQAA